MNNHNHKQWESKHKHHIQSLGNDPHEKTTRITCVSFMTK